MGFSEFWVVLKGSVGFKGFLDSFQGFGVLDGFSGFKGSGLTWFYKVLYGIRWF